MTFEAIFGHPPDAVSSAPGRVNLLGEHTDYNDGFVLPTAIPQRTTVALSRSSQPHHAFYADSLGARETFPLQGGEGRGFARYLLGCIRELEKTGVHVPPLEGFVASDVPMGAGLSSSAALEVAMLRALRMLLELPLDDVSIAQLGQRAEIHYAGVNCGIMDQMASSVAQCGHMLFLDTRTLERALVPFPEDTEVLVLDSGVARRLAESGYNARRRECQEAAERLGVAALRDVTDLERLDGLPPLLRKRARHVVTENLRVLEALKGVTAQRFGALMNASHQSLRDDYEVSVPPLDALVSLLQKSPQVYGSRLTGAGFGGACVALVASGAAREVAKTVLEAYAHLEMQGRRLVP